MEVKNINGTSGRRCECCDSWKGHWEKITDENAGICSRRGCSNKATKGAHVMRTTNQEWRIVPLCHTCNMIFDEWFDLKKGVKTVSADHYSCE